MKSLRVLSLLIGFTGCTMSPLTNPSQVEQVFRIKSVGEPPYLLAKREGSERSINEVTDDAADDLLPSNQEALALMKTVPGRLEISPGSFYQGRYPSGDVPCEIRFGVRDGYAAFRATGKTSYGYFHPDWGLFNFEFMFELPIENFHVLHKDHDQADRPANRRDTWGESSFDGVTFSTQYPSPSTEGLYIRKKIAISRAGQVGDYVEIEVRRGTANQKFEEMTPQGKLSCQPKAFFGF